jgi:hypothetical protein
LTEMDICRKKSHLLAMRPQASLYYCMFVSNKHIIALIIRDALIALKSSLPCELIFFEKVKTYASSAITS